MKSTPPVVVLDARVLAGSGGGPDKTLINSPRFLARDGYRMISAYMHDPADPGFQSIKKKADLKDAPLVSIPDHGPLDWRVVPRMLEVCRQERVKIWHGHDYKSNALGLVLKRFWPMRLVTTLHGWVQQTNRTPLYYWIDRATLRFYEHVFCVSEDLYQACRMAGVPSSRSEILQNGIDLEEYSRTRSPAEAKTALGYDSSLPLIGAVGRLSAEKGFDLLIRSADELFSRGLDFNLIIIGEGDEKEPLTRLIHELNRQNRVHLLGYHSDLRPFYEAMDIFVLSSIREGLPNVLLEAMAMETPVLSTRVAGIPKLIQSGVSGLLIEPGSQEELTKGITSLLQSPECRRNFATAGRKTVSEKFSFAERMARLAMKYNDMLSR
jgi:glycosyltransferase involved in cell wall biosynthesis